MGNEAKLVKAFRDYLMYAEGLKVALNAKNFDDTLKRCTYLIGELRVMNFFVEGLPEYERVHKTLMDKMASVYNIMEYARREQWDKALAEHPILLDPPLEENSVYEQPKRRYLSGIEIASILSNTKT
jgi:glutamine synthetase adenylyltransferase